MNNEIIEELKAIIDNLEKMSNEADNENTNVQFIQEINAAIECLKTVVNEL